MFGPNMKGHRDCEICLTPPRLVLDFHSGPEMIWIDNVWLKEEDDPG
jgi:hypothetical protein